MTTEKVKRKLTAILSADVKGYSRLISADKKGTVKALNACRVPVMRPTGLPSLRQPPVIYSLYRTRGRKNTPATE